VDETCSAVAGNFKKLLHTAVRILEEKQPEEKAPEAKNDEPKEEQEEAETETVEKRKRALNNSSGIDVDAD